MFRHHLLIMNKRISFIAKRILRQAAGLYVALMTSLFIFCFRNNYIDIQNVKANVFLILSGIYTAVSLICLLFLWCTSDDGLSARLAGLKQLLKNNVFLLLFIAAVLAGWLFSEWPAEAATGSSGRQLGAIALLLCAAVFALLSCFFVWHSAIGICFICSTAAQMTLGILNLWGFDPLGMYVNLLDEEHSFFIGTIGNKNVTAGFLCLVLPVLMAFLILGKNRIQKTASAFLLFAGFYYGLGVSSDSFLIGMGAAFLVLLWYCLSKEGRFVLFAEILGLFCAASWAMLATMSVFSPASPFFLDFRKDSLIGAWLHAPVLAAATLVLLLSYVIIMRLHHSQIRVVRNILFILLGILALSLLTCAVIVNALPVDRQASLPAALRHLILSDEFGSNRGYIWKRSVLVFRDLPFFKKLIGIGPDCFYLHFMPLYGNEMTILYGAPFADAHNELLQFLLTIGIAGAIGYFGTILTTCLKKKDPVPGMTGGILAAAWIAQGMVNNPQIVVTPLLFVFLGVLQAMSI